MKEREETRGRVEGANEDELARPLGKMKNDLPYRRGI